ncbi:MAG TPA: cytochrome C [Parvularcula sp.]|nr:cytochrome C [Parvularcula sp.]
MFRVVMIAGMLAATAAAADDGAAAWRRCAACHLADGKGIPGAFPRLAGRLHDAAQSEAGRAYLILVVTAGVMGPIDVDGRTIRGIMPAQAGMTDADVAAALNHASTLPGPDGEAPAPIKPFTAEEVAAVRAAHPGASPNASHAARAGVMFETGANP